MELIILATIIYIVGFIFIKYKTRKYPDSFKWDMFAGNVRSIIWPIMIVVMFLLFIGILMWVLYTELFTKNPYEQLIDMGWKPGQPIALKNKDQSN